MEEDTHKFKAQVVVISRFSSPSHSHERRLLIAVSGIIVVNDSGIPDRKDGHLILQHNHRLVTAQPHLGLLGILAHTLQGRSLGTGSSLFRA